MQGMVPRVVVRGNAGYAIVCSQSGSWPARPGAEDTTMKPRVLISVHVTLEQLARLEAAAPDVELVCAPGGIAFHAPSTFDAMEPTYPIFHPELDLEPLLATIDGVIAFDLPPDLPARAPRL